MGRPEHSDSDFLMNKITPGRSSNGECKSTYPPVCYKDLGEGTAVSGSLPAHRLDVMHRRAGRTGRRDKGVGKPRRMKRL